MLTGIDLAKHILDHTVNESELSDEPIIHLLAWVDDTIENAGDGFEHLQMVLEGKAEIEVRVGQPEKGSDSYVFLAPPMRSIAGRKLQNAGN